MIRYYDVHGLLRVSSNVVLPELEYFATPDRDDHPDIEVRVQLRGGKPTPGSRFVSISDLPGRVGFAADIEQFEGRIKVTAGLALRFSPHVLYTNVVEPIMRWQLVERGYVFAHGACIASANTALLVTAQTDTGKTTTILKTLDVEPYGFLSDDLTIMDAEGRLRCYPKPLTISSHTVAAVRSARLRPLERLTLPLQSRLHSKGGRKIAFKMTESKLPVASVNTLAQALIPPPKYSITRLVPGTEIATYARLGGMAIIVRAKGDSEEELGAEAAAKVLVSNTDDAYGFPPYNEIERFMLEGSSIDLRARERTIMTSALEGIPTVRLSSATMGWADRVRGWMRTINQAQPADVATRTGQPVRIGGPVPALTEAASGQVLGT